MKWFVAMCSCILLVVSVTPAGEIISPPDGSVITSASVTFVWPAGPGRSILEIGTTGPGSEDLLRSGFLALGVTEYTASNLPTNQTFYVRLLCETAANSGSFRFDDAVYNADADQDGIGDEIDANPGSPDPKVVMLGSNYVFTILGSGRVASLESPSLFEATRNSADTTQVRAITSLLYQHVGDVFDFILLTNNQNESDSYAGRFYNAKNETEGIGRSLFDGTEFFGSSGTLQGAIHLPTLSALRGGPSLHELCHNWGNSMSSIPSVRSGHWGYSSVGGQLGGFKAGSLVDMGNGTYQVSNPRTGQPGSFGTIANGGNGLPYSEFELYLMGMVPPAEVQFPIEIINDFNWIDSSQGLLSSTSITTRTMADIVQLDGARVPVAAVAQKDFRLLYVVITSNALSNAEWARVDQDVYDFDLDGDNGISSYNFWEATGGRGTVKMDDLLTTVRPGIEAIAMVTTNGSVAADIFIPSVPGFSYDLQRSGWLDGTWTNATTLIGTGSDLTFSVLEPPSVDRMFYRVGQSPLQRRSGAGDKVCDCIECGTAHADFFLPTETP